MDIKISDLLPDSGVTGLPGAADGDPKRVREAVMRKIKEENMNTKRRIRKPSRILLIVAAVAAVLSIAAIAYNSTLRDMTSGKEADSPYRAEPRDIITVLPQDSPTYKAFEEVNEFRREVQSQQPTGGVTQEEFEQIMADNERINQKSLEVAEKYGLKPQTESTEVRSVAELGATIHNGSLLPRDDPRAIVTFGNYTDIGTISYTGGFTLPGGGVADYGIQTATKGTMSTVGAAVYLDELEEWNHTTDDGTSVLLAIGERKSLLYVELEHCYVLAVLRTGSEGADVEIVTSEFDWNRGTHTAVTREDLEYFADNIGFAGIDAIAEAGQK